MHYLVLSLQHPYECKMQPHLTDEDTETQNKSQGFKIRFARLLPLQLPGPAETGHFPGSLGMEALTLRADCGWEALTSLGLILVRKSGLGGEAWPTS